MEDHNQGKKSNFLLLILVFLGLAAVATGYFLYFQQPTSVQPPSEMAAQVVTSQTRPETPQHKLQGALSKEEKDNLNLAHGWNEFQSPLDETASPTDSLESLRGLHLESLRSVPIKKPKPGQIIEENLPTPKPDPEKPKTPQTATIGASTPETTSGNKDQPRPSPEPVKTSQPSGQTSTKVSGTQTAATDDSPETKSKFEYFSPGPSSTVKGSNLQTIPAKLWVANVLSTQDTEKLCKTFDWLMAEKVLVYAYETEVKNEKWYRIRVGFFNSKAEAQAVGKKLAQKYNLPEPWIVRPSPREIAKYYEQQ